MRYSKFASWAISATAFLLIAALLIGVAMTVVDFYNGLGDGTTDAPTSEPTPPEQDMDGTKKDPEEEDEIKYATNLSGVLGNGAVEGLFGDISLVDGDTLSQLYEKLTSGIALEESVDGKPLAQSSSYSAGTHVIVKSDVAFSGPFAVGKKTVSVLYKIDSSVDPSIKDATVKIGTRDEEIDIKTVELYMGYIITNSENASSALYSSNGEVLLEDVGGKYPANKRTLNGEPVFSDASGAYYVFDGEKGDFASVEAEDILSGFEYDYPYRPYFNENGEQICAKYDPKTKKYKFYNLTTGKEVTSTAYAEAYALDRNGYCLVRSGTYFIVDANGNAVFKMPTANVYYYPDKMVNQGYWAKQYYERPYIADIRAIGGNEVDEHGYIRVRLCLVGRSSAVYGDIVADYETLYNVKTGEWFTLPEGYTLEGYSDGVLLLSREGRYGYYSVDGKWIAQPIYSYAAPFIQGLAVVGHEDGTKGMIDVEGNIVLPFAFSHVSNVSSGLISAYSESGGWEIFKIFETAPEKVAD